MSISIDSSSYFNLNTAAAENTTYKSDALQNTLKKVDAENSSDEELMDACKSFESYFIEQVFKEMKKTVHSPDDDNDYMQYFGDMMTEQYTKNIVDGEGMGIAKMLYESMKNNGL